jgi:hypothetical protein
MLPTALRAARVERKNEIKKAGESFLPHLGLT